MRLDRGRTPGMLIESMSICEQPAAQGVSITSAPLQHLHAAAARPQRRYAGHSPSFCRDPRSTPRLLFDACRQSRGSGRHCRSSFKRPGAGLWKSDHSLILLILVYSESRVTLRKTVSASVTLSRLKKLGRETVSFMCISSPWSHATCLNCCR